MKLGQVIEHKKRIFKKKIIQKINLFFKKALNQVNASGLQLSFNILQ